MLAGRRGSQVLSSLFYFMYFIYFIILILFYLIAAPETYGRSQARGLIELQLIHSQGNTGSEESLRPMTQVVATPDPYVFSGVLELARTSRL